MLGEILSAVVDKAIETLGEMLGGTMLPDGNDKSPDRLPESVGRMVGKLLPELFGEAERLSEPLGMILDVLAETLAEILAAVLDIPAEMLAETLGDIFTPVSEPLVRLLGPLSKALVVPLPDTPADMPAERLGGILRTVLEALAETLTEALSVALPLNATDALRQSRSVQEVVEDGTPMAFAVLPVKGPMVLLGPDATEPEFEDTGVVKSTGIDKDALTQSRPVHEFVDVGVPTTIEPLLVSDALGGVTADAVEPALAELPVPDAFGEVTLAKVEPEMSEDIEFEEPASDTDALTQRRPAQELVELGDCTAPDTLLVPGESGELVPEVAITELPELSEDTGFEEPAGDTDALMQRTPVHEAVADDENVNVPVNEFVSVTLDPERMEVRLADGKDDGTLRLLDIDPTTEDATLVSVLPVLPPMAVLTLPVRDPSAEFDVPSVDVTDVPLNETAKLSELAPVSVVETLGVDIDGKPYEELEDP